MKKYIIFFAAIALIIAYSYAREARYTGKSAKTSATGTFTAVSIDYPVKAVITVQEGVTSSVELHGAEAVLSEIKTRIEDSTLHIYSNNDSWDWFSNADKVEAIIKVPALVALSVNGSSNAEVQGNVTGNDFKLDISGSAAVAFQNLNVNDFNTDISGSGKITVNGGTVKTAHYEVSGAGRIQTFPLQASEVYASISGAGKADVTSLQKLNLDISGAASVHYKGHPAELVKEVSGAASVTAAD